LKTIVGVRADVYATDVSANDAGSSSGQKTAAIVSPKASVILGPWDKTELYADFGTGFHSNDARGVIADVPFLVRTLGVEVGARTSILPGLVTTLSLWYLHSDSELTFAGDSGDTDANAATRRYGVELASFYKPTRWLTLTADFSLTHARYIDNAAGAYIANSIPAVFTAGATVDTPIGMFGNARLRYFSRQPLIEDDSVEQPSSTLVDLRVGYRHAWYEISVEALNLFDAKTDDIAYDYTSRLPGEPAAGVNDVHVHPAEPFQVRVSLTGHY